MYCVGVYVLCVCLRRNEGVIGYTPDLENIQGG